MKGILAAMIISLAFSANGTAGGSSQKALPPVPKGGQKNEEGTSTGNAATGSKIVLPAKKEGDVAGMHTGNTGISGDEEKLLEKTTSDLKLNVPPMSMSHESASGSTKTQKALKGSSSGTKTEIAAAGADRHQSAKSAERSGKPATSAKSTGKSATGGSWSKKSK